MVKWIRKRTTDPEVGSSNHQQQKGKGKSEITGGRLGGSEQEGRVSGEMQKN